ncbi:hypothetical protein MYX82_14445 [Acidobacteria bacterium AH-259-D05]|nr:hypothetical protein [Acidobacteria bacterium AH-259-D05]
MIDLDFEKIKRESKELADRLYGDYSAFRSALVSDVKEAVDLLRANDTQFARRTYLRSFFAFVDGMLFAERTIVHEYTKNEADPFVPNRLTDAERMLLQEVEYELEDNGTVKIRGRNFQSFLKYLRFTFHLLAKFHRKSDSQPLGTQKSWEQ